MAVRRGLRAAFLLCQPAGDAGRIGHPKTRVTPPDGERAEQRDAEEHAPSLRTPAGGVAAVEPSPAEAGSAGSQSAGEQSDTGDACGYGTRPLAASAPS